MLQLKSVLGKFEKIICTYLGLEEEEVKPINISLQNNNIVISSTSSFKRHPVTESWDQFTFLNLKQTNQNNLEKIGIAAGKAIAKNLVISFDEPSRLRR